jgi:hypothetical protein
MTTPAELFGRAFSQWVATRTDNEAMRKDQREVASEEGVHPGYQWSDENFVPIGLSLEAFFDSLGWLNDGLPFEGRVYAEGRTPADANAFAESRPKPRWVRFREAIKAGRVLPMPDLSPELAETFADDYYGAKPGERDRKGRFKGKGGGTADIAGEIASVEDELGVEIDVGRFEESPPTVREHIRALKTIAGRFPHLLAPSENGMRFEGVLSAEAAKERRDPFAGERYEYFSSNPATLAATGGNTTLDRLVVVVNDSSDAAFESNVKPNEAFVGPGTATPYGVMVHELGHAIVHRVMPEGESIASADIHVADAAVKAGLIEQTSEGHFSTNYVRENISPYSATNFSELFAEIFALVHTPGGSKWIEERPDLADKLVTFMEEINASPLGKDGPVL